MSITKNKILKKALDLFNYHGFDGVTIRMIAQELNMSSGNLNYHFKKREDILEALYFEMTSIFDKRISDLNNQLFTFSFIRSEIEYSMSIMVDYQFFWTDIYHLTQLNTKIQNHFKQAYENRINGTLFMFAELTRSGLIVDTANEWELSFVAKQMIHYSNTWIYSSNFYQKSELNDLYIKECAIHLMRIFYPYLSEKGKRVFEKSIEH